MSNQWHQPGPMRPGPHLPSSSRDVRLGVVAHPIPDLHTRPALTQHIIGVHFDADTRLLTWTSQGIGIDLGDRTGIRVAEQPRTYDDIPSLLSRIRPGYGSWGRSPADNAHALATALHDDDPGSVLMGMTETSDPLGPIVRRDLRIASLFDSSPSWVTDVRVNTNGQWDGHIGSTDMHITTTIDDAAALLDKQWTEASYGRVRRTEVAAGDDPIVLERWEITGDLDEATQWTVTGELHYWTDGELRLDLDPTTVQR